MTGSLSFHFKCFVNVREIMWNHTISEELKKAKAEMARRIAEEEMGIGKYLQINIKNGQTF